MPDVVTVSDVMPLRGWRRTATCGEYFSRYGFDAEITLSLPHTKGQTNAVVFVRTPGRDFDERDLLVLRLARPHSQPPSPISTPRRLRC